MEKVVWLGVTPTEERRGDEASAAAAPFRKKHGLLAENMQPESPLRRVQMIPRAQGSQRADFHANMGCHADLRATGNVLPTNCHAAKTGEDSAGWKENHPGCG